jgi:hypothetical protein
MPDGPLDFLGHAIEYLTDEFVHVGGLFSAGNSQVQAIQLKSKQSSF